MAPQRVMREEGKNWTMSKPTVRKVGKSRTSRKKRLSWTTLTIVGVFLVAFIPMLRQNFRLRGQEAFYRGEVLRLEKENARLANVMEQMESPYLVEKIAREQLGLMKKGEVMFKVKESEDVSR